MRRYGQLFVFALCVVVSIGAMINVMSDNTDVLSAAGRVACGGDPCAATATRTERTPIAQTFDFATKKGNTTVRCTRAFVLFGEYGCVAE